jgi:uncharacterized protein (DUF2252 family)
MAPAAAERAPSHRTDDIRLGRHIGIAFGHGMRIAFHHFLDHAVRVVRGATALAPNLGERMLATRLLGKPMVLRELLPQDLKLEIEQFSRSEATRAARYLAYVVGVAHARQMDGPTRAHWANAIARRQSANIDAPTWLWDSVVDLIASHEAGYLEHCRRYALAQAA